MASEKRLIDANALLEEIERVYTEHYEKSEYKLIHDFFNAVRRRIRRATTVDAVEVVHGRWLPDMEEFDDDPAVGIRGGVFQTGWKCSICGRSEPAKEPYCNCGAKMDGERKDND